MTKIIGAVSGEGGNYVTASALQKMKTATVVTHTATEFKLRLANGRYIVFHGTGFTYNGTTPTGGTITSAGVQHAGTSALDSWNDFSVSMAKMWAAVRSANANAFNNLFFAGNDTFTIRAATGGENNYWGWGGNDTFNVQGTVGIRDELHGGDGNDTFNFTTGFAATDLIDGGAGSDSLNLNGDYAAGVTFGATTLTNVERMGLAAGHNYRFTTADATVAAGQTLTVEAYVLTSANWLNFNGSAETNGKFKITSGAGNDTLSGGAGADTFTLSAGGNDRVYGNGGNDTFHFAGALNAADQIDGGAGTDYVNLSANYAGLTLNSTMLKNIEGIGLDGPYNYTITTTDTLVASGLKWQVNAETLGATHWLNFNGTAETNGRFNITGGAGNDTLRGGAGADAFTLSRGGNDRAYGNGGNDTFYLSGALDASDRIDGGAGTDYVDLEGNYSPGLTLTSTMLANIEGIGLDGSFNYTITTTDAVAAAGSNWQVNAGVLGASNWLNFNGAAETDARFNITGGAGNDTLRGGAGNDTFNLSHGGNDTIAGNGGNDTINLGGTLTAADRIDGGAGSNTVHLDGDYAVGVSFGATTLTNVELMDLAAGHNYKFTTADATVAAGQTLTVLASALSSANWLNFNGSAETNGSFNITGGAGNDTLRGGAGDDYFDLTNGGNDTAFGNNGNDRFDLGANLTSADRIDGGAGTDYFFLAGNYAAGLTLTSTMLANTEGFALGGGYSYTLTTTDDVVAAGITWQVNGGALSAANSLNFNGSAETNGSFNITGGAGNDTLRGGAGADIINLDHGGIDTAFGNGGGDNFSFGATLTAADAIDGGNGNDTVTLDGDYSAGLTFGASTLVNIEEIDLADGHSYGLTINDANVAAGQWLYINGYGLGALDGLTVDGSAETSGEIDVDGGSGADTITGGAGDDQLYGNGGNDLIHGGAGSDLLMSGGDSTLYGDGGNDMLYGSGGNETLIGGDGNDWLRGGTGTDVIDGGAGWNRVSFASQLHGVTVDLRIVGTAQDYGDGTVTLTNIQDISGSQYADTLIGDGADNYLVANGGDDVLTGNGGADAILAGFAGTTTADGGDGTDTLWLADQDTDGLTFDLSNAGSQTAGAGTITAVNFENLAGTWLDDTLTGDGGDNVLYGSSGKDLLTGGEGNDTLCGDTMFTLIISGRNAAEGPRGTIELATTDGGDVDTLSGGAGNDRLYGGAGADQLNGGAGADTFVYEALSELSGATYDTITGFDGTVDKFETWLTVEDLVDPLSGTLSVASFNADLSTAVNGSALGTAEAVVFTASAGDMAGQTFLIVDANDQDGYQAGADLLIKLDAPTNLASLSLASFT